MKYIKALLGWTILGIILIQIANISTGAAHSPYILSSPPPQAAPFVEYEANVSAYCPCEKCCGQYADGITANGYKIKKGDKFVAAPKNIPFGTMIDVPGYGLVQVKDRGGAIKDNRLDLYFDTHQEALNWGRKHITVKVYQEIK